MGLRDAVIGRIKRRLWGAAVLFGAGPDLTGEFKQLTSASGQSSQRLKRTRSSDAKSESPDATSTDVASTKPSGAADQPKPTESERSKPLGRYAKLAKKAADTAAAEAAEAAESDRQES